MNVFISYSYDSDAHVAWVGKLADDLEKYSEWHILIDQYDLDHKQDKNLFMEESVTKSDLVLVVATKLYKEKADSRRKGAGFESQISVQRHLEEIDSKGKSNIILLLRENNSEPVYLSSKLYIDFTNDKKYTQSLEKLLAVLAGEGTRKRPQKSILGKSSSFGNMTRIEDVLKMIYHRRKCIISLEEGTDYSKGYRIKFELWEVKTPKIEHVLVLYNHITISQTIERFLHVVTTRDISLKSLTLLRIDEGPANPELAHEITLKYPGLSLSQFTLKEFIRDYCIDQELMTDVLVWTEPNFIDQPIYSVKDADQEKLEGPAIAFLQKLLNFPTSFAAHLILADGGDGKSILCSQLVNSINCIGETYNKKAILLPIETIRDLISSEMARNYRIASIYDIYNLFSLVENKSNNSYPNVIKNDFEVRVFCGNLVVVIDGLDELVAVFQDRFDKVSFFKSVLELNEQLKESQILLTSRGNIFSDSQEYLEHLDIYRLKGFDIDECTRYFKKRFSGEDRKDEIIRKSINNIQNLMENSNSTRIPPFIVDLVATINAESGSESDDDDPLSSITYPSNQDLTDKFVFHTLRREKKRQAVAIAVEETKDLLCEIASEHGTSISLDKLREIIDGYYGNQADKIYGSFINNPLLNIERGVVRYRYNFLYNYFLTLFIIEALTKPNYTANNNYVSAYATLAEGTTTSYKDIFKYCCSIPTLDYQMIFSLLRSKYSNEKTVTSKRAISFFVHLYIDIEGKGSDTSDLSKMILEKFTDDLQTKTIKYLFIYGKTSPLDFRNRRVSDSGFYQYDNFLRCKFEGAHFSNTTVELESFEQNLEYLKNITTETFDSTCSLGRLQDYFIDNLGESANTRSNSEVAFRRFFREFFNGKSFVQRSIDDVRFPEWAQSKSAQFFREALSQHVIYLTEDETACGITRAGQKIVHDYIVNNVLDKKLFKILKML